MSELFEKYQKYIQVYETDEDTFDELKHTLLHTLFNPSEAEWNDLTMEEKLILLKELIRIEQHPYEASEQYRENHIRHYPGDDPADLLRDTISALSDYLSYMLGQDFSYSKFGSKYSECMESLNNTPIPVEGTNPVTLMHILNWFTLTDGLSFWKTANLPVHKRIDAMTAVFVKESYTEDPYLVADNNKLNDAAVKEYLNRLDRYDADMKFRCAHQHFDLERIKRELSKEYRESRIELRDKIVSAVEKLDLDSLDLILNEYGIRRLYTKGLFDIKKYKHNYLYGQVIAADESLFTDFIVHDEKGSWSPENHGYYSSDKTVGDVKKEKLQELREREMV